MERILGHASERLLKRSMPTSLAAVTTGTGWSSLHFVAQSLGWPLENEHHGAAFLTVDGRIYFISTFEGGERHEKIGRPQRSGSGVGTGALAAGPQARQRTGLDDLPPAPCRIRRRTRHRLLAPDRFGQPGDH
jgi:hypothetical protein